MGIVGWPLGYSLSPKMHQAALKVAGLFGEYREFKVEPDRLDRWLHDEALTLNGFNVTRPHKNAVWKWLRSGSSEGSLDPSLLEEDLDAVNTVAVREGRPIGYNTDVDGFLRPMTDPPRRLTLAGWQTILLGSGGAAKAIATALALKTKAIRLVIWNRMAHLDRAKALAARVNALRGSRVFASATADWNALPMEESRLLVNATPMGMKGEEEPPEDLLRRVHHGQWVYDVVYEPLETALVRAGRQKGCPVVTGDEMLAGQGAAAFEIWTGVPAGQVLPAMKKELDEYFTAGD